MDKKEELNKLQKEMAADTALPLRKEATNLVFGEGSPAAEIFFLGEGPGYWEDQKGRPFVGNAGALLNQLLYSIKVPREAVWITNVVCFRPPQNREPLPEEIAAFQPYIDKMIEIIGPKIIVTLGRFSMAKFLPQARISSVHGKIFKINWKEEEKVVVPMYHPAAALRRSEIMAQIKEDFLKLPQVLTEVKNSEVKDSAKQMSLV